MTLFQIRSNIFICFVILYFINLILDYPLQGQFLSEYKSKNNYILFVHSTIWGFGIFIGLLFLNLISYMYLKLIFLVLGHMLIDTWKCRGWYKKINIKDWTSLYIDQFLHIIQIIICIAL